MDFSKFKQIIFIDIQMVYLIYLFKVWGSSDSADNPFPKIFFLVSDLAPVIHQ